MFSVMKSSLMKRISINSFINGNNFINRRRVISSLLLGLGIGSIGLIGVEGGYSQVVKRLSTSGIASEYPGHRPGNPITLNGQTYDNALYLNAYGDIVYPYYCPGVGGERENGEYVWNVVEQIHGNYSIIYISGECANGLGRVPAGGLIGLRTNGEVAPVTIHEFSGDRTTIRLGESLNLNWIVENASFTLLVGGELGNIQVPTTGSRTVRPVRAGTAVYVLVANGQNGTGRIQREFRVTVLPSAPSVRLEASTSEIKLGESFTLSWDAQNAQRVLLTGDLGGLDWMRWVSTSGSTVARPRSPGNHTYTVTVYGPTWERTNKTVTVRVTPR